MSVQEVWYTWTMRIGYARVSTQDQDTGSQLHALSSANLDMLFQETGSGAKRNRPELEKALAACNKGDTFVFFQLSRVGRSTQDLLAISNELRARGVEMQSLREGFDTSNAAGRMFFTVLAAMAEFERECMIERVTAGIANAKAHGTRSGRDFGQPKKMTPKKIETAKRELMQPDASYESVARILGVSRSLLYAKVPPSCLEAV